MLFKNTFLGKFCFFILLFLFIYPFKITGLPVSFRVLFAAFGGALLMIRLLALRNIYFSGKIFKLYLAVIPVCFISAISVFVVNNTVDIEYVNFWLLPTLCLFSAYFVISFGLYAIAGFDFFKLAKFYIAVVLAQAVISVFMFFNTSFYLALLSMQQMDAMDMAKSQTAAGSRLLGLGASFMIMGIINCIALLLIAVLLKYQKLRLSFRIYLIISYLIIFTVGMMQSRTTVVGLLVSVCYVFFSSLHVSLVGVKKAYKVLGGIVAVSLLLLLFIRIFAGDFIKKNEQIINYGFELLVNYQETGKFESASTNDLERMYIMPTSLKTYIAGDGRFNIVPGVPISGYYMHTDVGFLRMLYYFGIPGLFFFMLYQFLLTKYSFTVPLPGYKVLIFYFFLLVILWNLKNILDTNVLFTPFCMLNILKSKLQFANAKKAAVGVHQPVVSGIL